MHKLAVSLGQWNVDALARKLTAKQFIQWEMANALNPLGQDRADYQAALTPYWLWLVNTTEEERKEHPRTIEDFLLHFGPKKEKRPQSFEEQIMIARIMAMAAAAIHRETGR